MMTSIEEREKNLFNATDTLHNSMTKSRASWAFCPARWKGWATRRARSD